MCNGANIELLSEEDIRNADIPGAGLVSTIRNFSSHESAMRC